MSKEAEKRNPKRNRKWWATTCYTYDFAGNITEAVDGNGNKRSYAYDDNNQLKNMRPMGSL